MVALFGHVAPRDSSASLVADGYGDTGVGHPVGTKLEVTIGREPVMERNWTRGPALDPSTNKQGSNGRSNWG